MSATSTRSRSGPERHESRSPAVCRQQFHQSAGHFCQGREAPAADQVDHPAADARPQAVCRGTCGGAVQPWAPSRSNRGRSSINLPNPPSRLYRAAAHAALGEAGRARDAVAEAIASAPDLTTDYLETHEFYQEPAIKGTLIELLVCAGLPKGQSGRSLD
jgi:hypothetical protein